MFALNLFNLFFECCCIPFKWRTCFTLHIYSLFGDRHDFIIINRLEPSRRVFIEFSHCKRELITRFHYIQQTECFIFHCVPFSLETIHMLCSTFQINFSRLQLATPLNYAKMKIISKLEVRYFDPYFFVSFSTLIHFPIWFHVPYIPFSVIGIMKDQF